MNTNDSQKLLKIMENIEKMLHEVLLLSAGEKKKHDICEVCLKK